MLFISPTTNRRYDLHTIQYTYDKLERLRMADYHPAANLSAAQRIFLEQTQGPANSGKLGGMTRRHELTDAQWEKLRGPLPPEKPRTGRPNQDHRTMLNGMIWRAKTGRPWRDLPERYGKWKTVHSRWRRCRDAGVWQRVWEALQPLFRSAQALSRRRHPL